MLSSLQGLSSQNKSIFCIFPFQLQPSSQPPNPLNSSSLKVLLSISQVSILSYTIFSKIDNFFHFSFLPPKFPFLKEIWPLSPNTIQTTANNIYQIQKLFVIKLGYTVAWRGFFFKRDPYLTLLHLHWSPNKNTTEYYAVWNADEPWLYWFCSYAEIVGKGGETWKVKRQSLKGSYKTESKMATLVLSCSGWSITYPGNFREHLLHEQDLRMPRAL